MMIVGQEVTDQVIVTVRKLKNHSDTEMAKYLSMYAVDAFLKTSRKMKMYKSRATFP
jgi:hypothetical protein